MGVVAVAGLLLGSGSAAMAENLDDSFWYFDAFHVQDAHDAGIMGSGVTIAVIDTQINLEVPTLKGADIEVQPSLCWDESGVLIPPTSTAMGAHHGTNVASFIVGTGAGYPGQTGVKGVAPKAKVLYFMLSPTDNAGNEGDCLEADGTAYENSVEALFVDSAVAMGADIISVSLNGFPEATLIQAVARAENKGVVIVGGLPNVGPDGSTEHNFAWPAAANGAVAVQRIDANAEVSLQGASDYDKRVVVAGPGMGVMTQGSVDEGLWETQMLGYGTSYATPIVSSFMALVKDKYPKATGNQLIQTLIHNTGGDDHPLEFSTDAGLGYGVASATHMLKVDPTQYPDVNPLIMEGAGWDPSAEMIASPPPIHTPDASPTEPTEGASSLSWLLPIVIGGVIFLLLIIGVIILAVVLTSRRAKRPPTNGTGF